MQTKYDLNNELLLGVDACQCRELNFNLWREEGFLKHIWTVQGHILICQWPVEWQKLEYNGCILKMYDNIS